VLHALPITSSVKRVGYGAPDTFRDKGHTHKYKTLWQSFDLKPSGATRRLSLHEENLRTTKSVYDSVHYRIHVDILSTCRATYWPIIEAADTSFAHLGTPTNVAQNNAVASKHCHQISINAAQDVEWPWGQRQAMKPASFWVHYERQPATCCLVTCSWASFICILIGTRIAQSVQWLGYGMNDRGSIPDRGTSFATASRPALERT
jgi:hypothetical protein